MSRILGIDISLNHAAFVTFEGDQLSAYDFVTDRKKVADKGKNAGTYLAATKIKDKQFKDILRLGFWYSYLQALFDRVRPDFVSLEDYAFRSPQSAYNLGEVGGAARYHCYRSGAQLRLHDPASLKMYAVHDGSSDARETMLGILQRWSEAQQFQKYAEGKDARTVEDLCDAYALAQLLVLELRLRNGEATLKKLHQKEISVFNRVTSRYSTNLLDRPFVSRNG
jgi:Holliday junction resolvasome RuvABC endonuclease subunit